MKAIIHYPNIIIEEKEVELSKQEAAMLENMGDREKANLIFEKVQEFPGYERITELDLICEALEVGTANIELKDPEEER